MSLGFHVLNCIRTLRGTTSQYTRLRSVTWPLFTRAFVLKKIGMGPCPPTQGYIPNVVAFVVFFAQKTNDLCVLTIADKYSFQTRAKIVSACPVAAAVRCPLSGPLSD